MTLANYEENPRDGTSSVSGSNLRKPSSSKIWTVAETSALYNLPFNDLLFRAQTVHRANFDPNRVQLSRLLSIKTGGCPEDCA